MRLAFLGLCAAAAACSPTAAPGPTAPVGEPAAPAPAATPNTGPTAVVVAPTPPPVEEAPVAATEITEARGWVTFHGNAGRTGASDAPAIATPRILWSQRVGIQGWLNSPLAIGNHLVIVPSSGSAHNKPDPLDGVFALDFQTGKKLWHAHFDQDANGTAASEGRVFATSDDGHLYALDLRTGKEVWKQAGKGKMYTHPLLVGDRVVVGDAGGWVYAFRASDGHPEWSLQLTGAIRGGAAADDRYVYVASQGGEVAALTPAGKPAWRKQVTRPPWGGQGRAEAIEVYSTPIVAADQVIVPFARDTYYKDAPAFVALDTKTGKERWRAKGPGDWGNVRSTPVLVGGVLVYAEPYSGDIVGLIASTGRMIYRNTVGPCLFPSWASPAAAGDVAYVPRFDGSVYAVRAASGKPLWDLYLGDSKHAGKARPAAPPSKYGCEWDVATGFANYSPAAVADDGTLFVGTGEGLIFAIGPR